MSTQFTEIFVEYAFKNGQLFTYFFKHLSKRELVLRSFQFIKCGTIEKESGLLVGYLTPLDFEAKLNYLKNAA